MARARSQESVRFSQCFCDTIHSPWSPTHSHIQSVNHVIVQKQTQVRGIELAISPGHLFAPLYCVSEYFAVSQTTRPLLYLVLIRLYHSQPHHRAANEPTKQPDQSPIKINFTYYHWNGMEHWPWETHEMSQTGKKRRKKTDHSIWRQTPRLFLLNRF